MTRREFDGLVCLFVGTAMTLAAATSSAEPYLPDENARIQVADLYMHTPKGSLAKVKHSKSNGSTSKVSPDQRLANPKQQGK